MRSLMSLIFLSCAACQVAAANPNPPDPGRLASRVARTAGSPYQVAAIDFTFVVVEDGVEKARRQHRWCPAAGRFEVHNRGERTRLNISDPEAQKKKAYAWFINDGYWLFAPSKVLDPGVHRTGVGHQLVLTFDHVGLTPQDWYVLHIDEETGLVDSWSFALQGGRRGLYRWLEYRDVGPLKLSTIRRNNEGREIRFEDLKVHGRCPLNG